MLLQLLLNGIIAGAAYALVAVSFGIIYSTARFFHFAHGAVYVAAPYCAYVFIVWAGMSPLFALPVAMVIAASLGAALEFVVYRPLRRRGASPLILLLASLGLLIFLQNLISLAFGDQARTLRQGDVVEGIRLLGARVTPVQTVIVLCSVLSCALVWVFLHHTQMGRIVRAVGNDSELARMVGMDSDRALLVTFFVGSGLAGMAGILVSYDTDMRPTMGLQALLIAVVAVIIGGTGSVEGSFLGALLIGLVQNLVVWKISTQWQDAITFLLLLLFLLLRPQGLLGRASKGVAV